jgi:hypothetical protein
VLDGIEKVAPLPLKVNAPVERPDPAEMFTLPPAPDGAPPATKLIPPPTPPPALELPPKTFNTLLALPLVTLVPTIESKELGDDDPIPTFPFCRIVKSDAPDDDAMFNGLVPPVPWMLRVADEVVVPTLNVPPTVSLPVTVEVPIVTVFAVK